MSAGSPGVVTRLSDGEYWPLVIGCVKDRFKDLHMDKDMNKKIAVIQLIVGGDDTGEVLGGLHSE